MKKLRSLIALFAMASMAVILIGCGDDDDRDESDDAPQEQEPRIGPPDESSLVALEKVYTVTIAGQSDPQILTFPAAGRYQLVQAGAAESGTVSGATRIDNTWTLNLTPDAGQQDARAGLLRLDFTATEAGLWTFTPTGDQPETGTFTVTIPRGVPPGTDPDPTRLVGKTLQLNYSGGGGEKFEFVTDTDVSYENGAETGTYTWDSINRRLNVRLNNGWLFEITLPPGGNTATVIFSGSIEPETDTASYTLL